MPEEKRKPIYNAEKNQFHAIYPSFIMKYFMQIQTVDVFTHTHTQTHQHNSACL